MNFTFMPELTWKYGYVAALGIMGVLDVYVFYRLRKARWI
jgi:magnesium transporter